MNISSPQYAMKACSRKCTAIYIACTSCPGYSFSNVSGSASCMLAASVWRVISTLMLLQQFSDLTAEDTDTSKKFFR